MKRSEMLKIIQTVLCSQGFTGMLPSFYDQDAKEILNIIEEAGMLPPMAEFLPIERKVMGFDPGPKSIWSTQWEPEE